MKRILTVLVLAFASLARGQGQYTLNIPNIPQTNFWSPWFLANSPTATDAVQNLNLPAASTIVTNGGTITSLYGPNGMVFGMDGSIGAYLFTGGIFSGNHAGNGFNLTTLNAASLVGTGTNNTTGTASTATNAQTVPWSGVTGAPAIGSTNGFITKPDATNVVNSMTNSMSIGGTAANANNSSSLGGLTSSRYPITTGNISFSTNTANLFFDNNGNLYLGFGITSSGAGNSCVFIGNSVADAVSGDASCTAVGQGTYDNITGGLNNTSIGTDSMRKVSAGNNNTVVGAYSLSQSETSFYDNTTLGYFAAANLNTGTNNIAIGSQSAINWGGAESGNICIGNPGVSGEQQTIHLGTPGVQTNAYIAGVINGNGGGLTNIQAVGISTNGSSTGQILESLNGKTQWTNAPAGYTDAQAYAQGTNAVNAVSSSGVVSTNGVNLTMSFTAKGSNDVTHIATNAGALMFQPLGMAFTNTTTDVILASNLVMGVFYTNNYNTQITIQLLRAVPIVALTAGNVSCALELSGVGTNLVYESQTVSLIGSMSGADTNGLPTFTVAPNGIFRFVDTSSGAGNSTSLALGSQIVVKGGLTITTGANNTANFNSANIGSPNITNQITITSSAPTIAGIAPQLTSATLSPNATYWGMKMAIITTSGTQTAATNYFYITNFPAGMIVSNYNPTFSLMGGTNLSSANATAFRATYYNNYIAIGPGTGVPGTSTTWFYSLVLNP